MRPRAEGVNHTNDRRTPAITVPKAMTRLLSDLPQRVGSGSSNFWHFDKALFETNVCVFLCLMTHPYQRESSKCFQADACQFREQSTFVWGFLTALAAAPPAIDSTSFHRVEKSVHAWPTGLRAHTEMDVFRGRLSEITENELQNLVSQAEDIRKCVPRNLR